MAYGVAYGVAHGVAHGLVQRLDVLGELTDDVSGRTVAANYIVTPGVVAALGAATDLGAALPDDLGEVPGGGGEGWVAVVVVLDLVVPGVDGAGDVVAEGQVFTVWTAGVGQSAGAVVFVGVGLGVAGQVVGPR